MRLLDLFCGRGGWSTPAIARGWTCIGIDIANHGYPGQLIRTSLPLTHADLLSLHPDLVVASPPCEAYARHHLPWMHAYGPIDERLLRWSVDLTRTLPVPVIVECSRFAGWHLTPDRWTRPYALWGSLPALLPHGFKTKDARRGHSATPRTERAARAAELPPELTTFLLEYHERKAERQPG